MPNYKKQDSLTLKKADWEVDFYSRPIIDSKGKEHFFGNQESPLKAKLKINSPSFCLNLLRKGSSGLGESYINNEFETNDLSSLIELSARNINITYKFSGFFQLFSLNNFLNKNIFSIWCRR